MHCSARGHLIDKLGQHFRRDESQMLMAPHSMPALIKGSSGGDYSTMARLCEFLEIGSRFGVDVQLFSNLFANDAWFMRNCSSSLL